ncbi:MAG: helix-turn-helix domain-containing protein [Alphaproteobacteria bacterium]|nr:helix-turn-helix domain-containing protein [Alphaproteobacteria bacterium]
MDLTLREAATLLGRSPRTLRGQLARGDVPGRKKGGRWLIPSDTLPLTEPQRRALQAKADEVRELVEDALPSRTARRRKEGLRSVVDLEAFRVGRPVLRALQAADRPALVPAAAELERCLVILAEGCHLFHREPKLAALNEARSHLGRAIGHLALAAEDPTAEPEATWLSTLEREALPALSGLVRWAERLPQGRA